MVDNGSTDGSIKYVGERFPWVKLIEFDRNYGFAKAYDLAICEVDSEYVVFLNNDTEVTRDWLSELVKPIVEDECVVACGSKMLFRERRDTLQHAGIKVTPMGGGYDIGYREKDVGQYDRQRPVGAVSGASMLVRKSKFQELGGFDEDFFAYHEDTDFCWRAWLCGYKTIYVPTSVMHHVVGGTAGERLSSLRLFFGRRNRLMSLCKNFESKNLAKALVITLLYDAARFLLFIKSGLVRGVIETIRAHGSVLRNLRRILAKRKVIQRDRVMADKDLVKMGLMGTVRESVSEFRKVEF